MVIHRALVPTGNRGVSIPDADAGDLRAHAQIGADDGFIARFRHRKVRAQMKADLQKIASATEIEAAKIKAERVKNAQRIIEAARLARYAAECKRAVHRLLRQYFQDEAEETQAALQAAVLTFHAKCASIPSGVGEEAKRKYHDAAEIVLGRAVERILDIDFEP